MNNRVLYLVGVLLALISLYLIKYSQDLKKESLKEFGNFVKLKQKASQIIEIENKLNKNLSSLKHLCKINSNQIECKNLKKSQFRIVENRLFKGYFVFENFSIEENNNSVTIKAKIEQ